MSNVFALLHLRKFYFGSLLGSLLVLLPLGAYAATSNSATLQWAANTESDLAGYKVYHGTSPGIYGTSLDAGKVTSYQYLNLDPNKSHYFTVTAYDTTGNESLPSPEVSKTIIVTTPTVSDQKTVSVSNQGTGSVSNSGTGSVSNQITGSVGSALSSVSTATAPVSKLLLTDDFNDGNFTGWQVVNEGTWEGPSSWAVMGGALQQTSNIYDGNTDGAVLPKKGTFVWYTAGQSWSNYQVGVELWSTDDDALGVMVRYRDPGNYYRFSWDAQRQYRRLVKVVNGQVTLLRQDTVPYVPNQKYQVEVLAQGPTLEVRVDGVPLFGGPVVDSALATGSVALYSWGNTGSVFEKVQVSVVPVSKLLLTDDFNDGNFTGWQVVNEGTWEGPSSWAVMGGALQQTSNIYDGNTDGAVLPKKGTFVWYTAGQSWSNYQVGVELWSTDDDALGVMVRYRDPGNYYRFSWDAQRQYRRLVKVVNGQVTLLRQDTVPYVPNQKYQVEVLAQGPTLEVRVDGVPLFGGPVVDSALATGSVALYSWGNTGSVFEKVQVSVVPASQLLLTDDFNDGNFTGWQVVNEGTWEGPSSWAVMGGALQQTSNIYDGNTDGAVLPKKGTFAWYTAGQSWSNYQVGVELWSTDDDALGVMVRYRDPGNYYRFSWDAQRQYRRLVKVVNGQVTLLRQDTVPYVPNQKYQVEVLAQGPTLEVRVDGVPLFGGPVVDSALATGSVALYSWGNTGSVFEKVQVSVVPVSKLLLTDDFNDGNFTGWQVVNEGTWEGPSSWAVMGGALQQTSNIYDGNTDGAVLPKKGTFAWYTAGQSWSNYQVGVELWSTDDDALGVMVRYRDPGNYYRFSWDAQRQYRRLVKVVNGQVTLLRQDTVPYVPNQKYQVEVLAQGPTLEVRVDGVPLFGGPVVDSALATGSVALYSWGNTGSVFEKVQVSVVPVSNSL